MRLPRDRQRLLNSNNKPLRCSHKWWDNEGIDLVYEKVDPMDPMGVKRYMQRVEITIP
jgi:hypothetical protein